MAGAFGIYIAWQAWPWMAGRYTFIVVAPWMACFVAQVPTRMWEAKRCQLWVLIFAAEAGIFGDWLGILIVALGARPVEDGIGFLVDLGNPFLDAPEMEWCIALQAGPYLGFLHDWVLAYDAFLFSFRECDDDVLGHFSEAPLF